MSFFPNSPGRIKLKKNTRHFFESNGWKIQIQNRIEYDFDFMITKGDLCFLVKCIDITIRLYSSTEKIFTELNSESRNLKVIFGQTLITVLDDGFRDVNLDFLLTRGLFLILFEELSFIVNLDKYLSIFPENLDAKETFLLKTTVWFPLSVSKRYHSVGNNSAAIQWAKCAVENSGGIFNPYMVLFKLLRDIGDWTGAEKVGLEALSRQPFNKELLAEMKELSLQQGNTIAAARFESRLSTERIAAHDFSDIVKRQQSSPRPISQSVEPVIGKCKISRFVSLFSRSKR